MAGIGGFNQLRTIIASSVSFSCKHLSLFWVQSNPGPCKLCPKCSTTVSNKKNTCECGYVFHKYKKGKSVEGRRQSARIALKRKIESEAETTYRKEQNKLYVTRKRSLESPQEASYRKEKISYV